MPNKDLSEIQEIIETAENLNDRGNTSAAELALAIASAKALLALVKVITAEVEILNRSRPEPMEKAIAKAIATEVEIFGPPRPAPLESAPPSLQGGAGVGKPKKGA